MTRSWSSSQTCVRRAVLAAVLMCSAQAATDEDGPVQLQVIVTGEKAVPPPSSSLAPSTVAASASEPLAGATVRVGDIRKTTGASGDVTFTLDKKKKIRITVVATEFQTLEKRPDLTKDPLEDGATCAANVCSVQLQLKRK